MLVALLSEKADVQYAADRISPDKIVEEIQRLGFGAQLLSESDVYQEGQLDLSVSPPTGSLISVSSTLFLYLSFLPPLPPLLLHAHPHTPDNRDVTPRTPSRTPSHTR